MQIAGSKEQQGGRRAVCISRGMPRTLYTTLAGQSSFKLWQITKKYIAFETDPKSLSQCLALKKGRFRVYGSNTSWILFTDCVWTIRSFVLFPFSWDFISYDATNSSINSRGCFQVQEMQMSFIGCSTAVHFCVGRCKILTASLWRNAEHILWTPALMNVTSLPHLLALAVQNPASSNVTFPWAHSESVRIR